MKKIQFLLLFVFLFGSIQTQVLNVPQVIQEQNQWCWAGVSKAILQYYGVNKMQCEIADYARQVIDWHNFGPTDCCVSATQGCNYWNYNYGSLGSIEDILVHFGDIQNYGYGNYLTLSEINDEISQGHPFVVRWGWYSGGGHFVVGHGAVGNDVYYMNPWFGEGLHISTYDWLVDDGEHSWTHTNIITSDVAANQEISLAENGITIYQNLEENSLNIKADFKIEKVKIVSSLGQIIFVDMQQSENKTLDISNFETGIYYLEVESEKNTFVRKFIKN